MIRGEAKNTRQVQEKIKKIPQKLVSEIRRIFTVHSRLMLSYVRKEHLTGGTTDTRLKRRSGFMNASTKIEPTIHAMGIVNAGISFGAKYARVHVGPKGQVTTIRPKSAKMLTIPLPAAQTRAGVLRAPARSSHWGNTFIQRSKAGNLIIFGQKVNQKGQSAGEATGPIVPLFLLKPQVKVKARIHPEGIITHARKMIIDDFEKIGVKLT